MSVGGGPLKKLSTATRIVRQNGLGALFGQVSRKLVTVTPHRVDLIRIDDRQIEEGVFNNEQFEVRFASPEDLRKLLETWPDPQDELERHRKVIEQYGFKRCALVIDREHKQVAHFQFLLTTDDTDKVKKWLPWNIYRGFWGPGMAWQEWVYTMTNYRRRGLSVLGLEYLLAYCQREGIKKLYSRRGLTNTASVKMANRTRFEQIGTIYEVQLLGKPQLSRMLLSLNANPGREASS